MSAKQTSGELTLTRACRVPSNTTLLVGAGISVDRPSNIPLAGAIMDLLCEWLSRDAPDVRDALDQLRKPPSARNPYLGPYATLRFELLLQWIAYIEPRTVEIVASSARWGSPNRWHWWIADMIGRGAQVLTTNFDTRIEDACRRRGIPCTTVVLSHKEPCAGTLRSAQLIKLHGSFAERHPYVRRSTAPVTTLRQIGRWGLGYERLGPLRQELLDTVGNRVLIVCGYSGSDSFDVMPLLEDARRSAALVWYEWARGPLREINPSRVDALTTRRTTTSMSEAFLAYMSAGGVRPVHFRGSSAAFLRLVSEHRPRRRQRLVCDDFGPSDDEAPHCATDVLDRMRDRLLSAELRVRPSEARAVVRRLRMTQGIDIDDIYTGLKARKPVAPRPMRQEVHVLAALDRGDIRWATSRFLEEIRRSEEPGDRMAQAETVTSILAEMFWFAIRNGQHGTAEMLVNRLVGEARRRGVLWAYPEILYLRANLLHEYGFLGGNPRWGDAPTCLELSKKFLEDAVRYAVRIPRVDIVTDALRLLLYIEPNPVQRNRLLLALRVWSLRVDDGEERLLALFDLVRQHVKAGLRPPSKIFSDLQLAVRRCPDLKSGRGYLATARCYMALIARSPNDLKKALFDLDRVLVRLHPKLRTAFAREADEFRAYLAAWHEDTTKVSDVTEQCLPGDFTTS